MKPLHRRPEVERDITRYALHIAADNPRAAEDFVDAAQTSFRRIAQFPMLGRLRRWKSAGLAGVRSRPMPRPFGAWQVIYRESSESVEILRLLHGAVDMQTRVSEPPE